MDDFSLADIKSVVDDGGFGGSSAWVLIILFALIFGWGGTGFGNGSGALTAATTADIQRAVDLNSIQQGQAGIAADVQRTTYETMATVKDAAYNNLGEIRDVESSTSAGFAGVQNALTSGFADQKTCCCETNRNIDSVRFDMANYAAQVNANTTEQTQKVLDALATNRIADMQSQINQLQLQNAVAGTVKYPSASTYYAGNNPFGTACCGNI